VLSIIWTLCGAILGNREGIIEGQNSIILYHICKATTNADQDACQQTFIEDTSSARVHRFYYAAFFAFGPIVLAWLAAYFTIWIGRWIKRGFTNNGKP